MIGSRTASMGWGWLGPLVLVTLFVGSGLAVPGNPASPLHSEAPRASTVPPPPAATAAPAPRVVTPAVTAPQSELKTIRVGSQPAAEVYDPLNGYVYVANSNGTTVTILNGTGVVVPTDIGYDSLPYKMAVDTQNGWVYVVHTGEIGFDGYNLSIING